MIYAAIETNKDKYVTSDQSRERNRSRLTRLRTLARRHCVLGNKYLSHDSVQRPSIWKVFVTYPNFNNNLTASLDILQSLSITLDKETGESRGNLGLSYLYLPHPRTGLKFDFPK